MAEILNNHGIETYYISFHKDATGHDSSIFHYEIKKNKWDLTPLFIGCSPDSEGCLSLLKQIRNKYAIHGCMATGGDAYLLKLAGIIYHYWCFGSDLDQISFYPIWPYKYPLKNKLLYYSCYILMKIYQSVNYRLYIPFTKMPWNEYIFIRGLNIDSLLSLRNKQRKSISDANSVMIAPYQLKSYLKICRTKKLFFFPHFLEIEDYEVIQHKKNRIKKELCKQFKAKGFFFSSTRHFWCGEFSHLSDNKGNDIILESFATYLSIYGDQGFKLLLINKGPHLDETKILASKLGLDKYVIWINEMKRIDLLKYYTGADICFGQFGTPVLTNVVVEPLSQATPCISYFIDGHENNIPYYKDMPPVFNSKNPKSIADFINRLATDTEFNNKISYQSWDWVNKNCNEKKFVSDFQEIFES